MEPGNKTSEFWVTLLSVAIGAVTTFLGQFYGEALPEWARAVTIGGGAVLVGLSTLGYQANRTLRKNHVTTSEKEVILAQEKTDSESGRANILVLTTACVLIALLALPGCDTLQLSLKDETTLEQIHKTLDFESANHAQILEDLTGVAIDPVRVDNIKTRHESEVARLQAWLKYEEAKISEEEVQ